MRIQPRNQDRPPYFTGGYQHYLKSMYKKGLLPSVTKDLYGSELTKDTVSLEHLKPHSLGGSSTLKNYALATIHNNNKRGTKDLSGRLDVDMVKQYLEQFKSVTVKYRDRNGRVKFNGDRYIELVKSTLRKLGVEI